MEIILAYFGIVFLTGGAFFGSALGVTICGNATVAAMKKNPNAMGVYIPLSALPSSQGLYGFVGYFMLQKFLTPEVTALQAWAIFSIGIMMGATCFYSALRQSQVCANGIKETGAGHNVFAATMVMAVFPELYAILALLVTILVSGTI
jgi:V/A-type H+-transporting ATPase subunit K